MDKITLRINKKYVHEIETDDETIFAPFGYDIQGGALIIYGPNKTIGRTIKIGSPEIKIELTK
jgi:hypothetical protein